MVSIFRNTVFILSGIFILSSSVLAQEKRLALVIGNEAYEHSSPLKNPVNDANLMTSTLEGLGFEVIKRTNATLENIQDAFEEFVLKMDEYDVALFFYAGHGIQVSGENYLLPIDAQLKNLVRVEFEAFKVSNVNQFFAYNNDKLNIMILDACRNNPFTSWNRGGGNGFQVVNNQAVGTIIAFATREGETAFDGEGENGLYTKHLVKQMLIEQNITDVFQNTRLAVMEESRNQQVPQEWNMLTGNFYFTKFKGDTIRIEKPSLASGNLAYGSLSISSDFDGVLFLDEERMGAIKAFSQDNKLTNITPGGHILTLAAKNKKIEKEIYVEKEAETKVSFKNEVTDIKEEADWVTELNQLLGEALSSDLTNREQYIAKIRKFIDESTLVFIKNKGVQVEIEDGTQFLHQLAVTRNISSYKVHLSKEADYLSIPFKTLIIDEEFK